MTTKIKKISKKTKPEVSCFEDVCESIDLATDLGGIFGTENHEKPWSSFSGGTEMTWEQMGCNIPYEQEVKRRAKIRYENRIIKPLQKLKNRFYKFIFDNFYREDK